MCSSLIDGPRLRRRPVPAVYLLDLQLLRATEFVISHCAHHHTLLRVDRYRLLLLRK